MATFTWTTTSGSSTGDWENPLLWGDAARTGQPSTFTTAPGDDYFVGSSNFVTINNIGTHLGTADVVNSLTVTNLNASLQFTPGGELDVTTTLTLNTLLNLGTAAPGGSILRLGDTASAGGVNGVINLLNHGRIEGALGDSIQHAGPGHTEITFTTVGTAANQLGTLMAEGGIFQIGTSVQIVDSHIWSTILPNATLAFADAVVGTVAFGVGSGSGELEVGALSTFNASVTGLFIGKGQDKMTSFIDFLNVGTTATATLTNITTAITVAGSVTPGGATLNIFPSVGHGASHSITLIANTGTSYVGKHVNYFSDGVGGFDVFLTDTPCYAMGTAMLTPDGEVAVETIQAGDSVMTVTDGRLVPETVIWTGLREIDLSRHPAPEAVAPIRFQPARSVTISRGAICCCRRIIACSSTASLIPAKLLVNSMTIVRDLSANSVSYHHIELARHAVLIAEGVEAESYLDTGNRAYFSNAGLATILHPEFGINEHLRCWETDACAPLIVRAEAVKPVWERFAARAVALGFRAPEPTTTTDPGLRLVVDGGRCGRWRSRSQMVRFVVPDGARSVRLVSRSTRPARVGPWLDDPRRLGVAVRSMMLRDRTGRPCSDADHPALTDGWHAAEYAADGAPWRWSDGDAVLPIVSDGPCLLEITLGGDHAIYRHGIAWPPVARRPLPNNRRSAIARTNRAAGPPVTARTKANTPRTGPAGRATQARVGRGAETSAGCSGHNAAIGHRYSLVRESGQSRYRPGFGAPTG